VGVSEGAGQVARRGKLSIILRRTGWERYSLAALVAALDVWARRNGTAASISIHFADTPPDTVKLAERASERGKRVIVGYSILTTSLPSLLSELQVNIPRLRALGALVLAGGPHASGDPVGTLNLGFDAAVVGDGEEVLAGIVDALINNGDPLSVKGLVYKSSPGRYCFTGRSLTDINRYPNFPYWRGIYSPIELTRGCNYACRFCQVSFTHGGRLRHRNITLVEEMAEALLAAGRSDLRFITPNAFSYLGDGRKPRVDALCTLLDVLEGAIKRHGGGRIFLGTFPSEIRPEHAADPDAVECIAGRVSNKRVIIGAQSGSERILRLMNRGHGVEEVIAAVETLNEHGFQADVDIILGFPGERPEDVEATVELCELLTYKYNARIHAHFYLPLPGTPIAHLEPSEPPAGLVRRLFRLMGRGKLYGEWLRQREISMTLTRMYKKGVIVGLRGWRFIKRCESSRLYPSSPLAS
jgi:B12-binding domain/radical SAM domain protein